MTTKKKYLLFIGISLLFVSFYLIFKKRKLVTVITFPDVQKTDADGNIVNSDLEINQPHTWFDSSYFE